VTVPARYIDIHLLHTVPYANLNRDDLGSPKSVRYGDAERTRVSSQCWKRAVRLAMEAANGDPAARTRRVPVEVAALLRGAGWDDDLATFAGQQIAAAAATKGISVDAKTGETSVLLYLPKSALGDLAQLCQIHQEALVAAKAATGRKTDRGTSVLPRAEVNAILAGRNAVINLFGRMLADLPSSNVDGAVQVAHAFTTHETDPQVDFFTAVDDLNLAEDTGSGHMNGAEFSAGTFYRYASVNLADLTDNLDGDTALAGDLAAAFLSTFITAMPGAKKNSTAPFTLPDLAYIAVRADRPVSLAAAFEAPVRAQYGSFALRSRQELDHYAGQIYRLLGDDGRIFHGHAAVQDKDELAHLGSSFDSYRALVDAAVGQTGLR
jgi:CRISPR system Cascade subunit CasC